MLVLLAVEEALAFVRSEGGEYDASKLLLDMATVLTTPVLFSAGAPNTSPTDDRLSFYV